MCTVYELNTDGKESMVNAIIELFKFLPTITDKDVSVVLHNNDACDVLKGISAESQDITLGRAGISLLTIINHDDKRHLIIEDVFGENELLTHEVDYMIIPSYLSNEIKEHYEKCKSEKIIRLNERPVIEELINIIND